MQVKRKSKESLRRQVEQDLNIAWKTRTFIAQNCPEKKFNHPENTSMGEGLSLNLPYAKSTLFKQLHNMISTHTYQQPISRSRSKMKNQDFKTSCSNCKLFQNQHQKIIEFLEESCDNMDRLINNHGLWKSGKTTLDSILKKSYCEQDYHRTIDINQLLNEFKVFELKKKILEENKRKFIQMMEVIEELAHTDILDLYNKFSNLKQIKKESNCDIDKPVKQALSIISNLRFQLNANGIIYNKKVNDSALWIRLQQMQREKEEIRLELEILKQYEKLDKATKQQLKQIVRQVADDIFNL